MKLDRDVSINSDKGEGHGVDCIYGCFLSTAWKTWMIKQFNTTLTWNFIHYYTVDARC